MALAATKKFRVLIVDDSAFMRKVLETIFNADDQLQVAGHAKDGREAIALAESLKPDVITMDINMPHMDGLQATAQIMTTNPKPIVIVSSESKEGAASTLKALELGAIEFVAKPSSGIDLDMQSVKDDLLRKVRMAAKVRVVRTASRVALTVQGSNGSAATAKLAPMPVRTTPVIPADQRFPVVVLGSASGGASRPDSPATSLPRFSWCSTCRRLSPRNTRHNLLSSPAFASRKRKMAKPCRPAPYIYVPARSIFASVQPAAFSSMAHPAASAATCQISMSPWKRLRP